VRQRDALARRSRMSIARFAAPVWHAVARQVHRMVRHTRGANKCGDHDLDAATARRGWGRGQARDRLTFVLPAAAIRSPGHAMPPTEADPTSWMKHDLGACGAARRAAQMNLHGDAALSLALNSHGSIADDATPCGKAVPSVALRWRLVKWVRKRPTRSARCFGI
jgi:hypothetical protein